MTENDLRSSRLAQANELRRRSWAREAARYDSRITWFERRLLGAQHRGWVCSRASGRTLEVAIGTGLNLGAYSPQVELVGIDLSPEMLDIARQRARALPREVELQLGDAHALPFRQESFDTVVCTYSLCNIPDPDLAVAEMARVLRVGGRMALVDHIASSRTGVLWIQKALEALTARWEGEHLTRRPLEQVLSNGLEIKERERLGPAGVVERLVAVKP